MAITCSTAVSAAACNRGSLLHMPLCAPSTSRASLMHLNHVPNTALRAHVVPTATSRHTAAAMAAAAVLDVISDDEHRSETLNPDTWLYKAADAAADWEQQTAAPNSSSMPAGPSSRRRRNNSGQYLGVYGSAEASDASAPAASNAQAEQGAAASPDVSTTRSDDAFEPRISSSRQRSRGRPNARAISRLKAQYSSLFEELESEQTALLHKHEQEFMHMMYAGATEQQLQQQHYRHDMAMHKLQSQYSQKWGPPVARNSFLRASGPRQQQQRRRPQQQQQAIDPASPGGSSSSSSSEGMSNSQPHNNAEPRALLKHQQKGEHVDAQGGANPIHPAATRSSDRVAAVAMQPTRSAFDIPDETPELLAAAAAAQDEAAAVQRFTNQMVGAKVIAEALKQDSVDIKTLDGLEVVYLHLALPKLVAWRLVPLMIKLTEYLLTRPDRDAHTYGAIFNAYALANRTDLALSVWDRLNAAGVDIGPYGSSALIKACARHRDVGAALRVFDQFLRRRVTFNSYTYNCLLHLCCSAGNLDDALAIYNLQRLETSPRSLPDVRTYTAIMRGVLVTGRVELTQQLFENMLEDNVTADPKLYLNFLNAAGRAGNLGLARYLYQHLIVTLDLDHSESRSQQQQQQRKVVDQEIGNNSGSNAASSAFGVAADTAAATPAATPAAAGSLAAGSLAAILDADPGSESDDNSESEPKLLYLVNSLLFAHAQLGVFKGALAVYQQELLGRGLTPDAYTCTALLVAAARSAGTSLSWLDVQSIVDIMLQYNVALTTQLGTALVNAYRRVRIWQRPAAAAAASSSEVKQKDGRRNRGSAGSSSDGDIRSDPVDLAAQRQQQQLDQQKLFSATGAPALPGIPPVIAASLYAAGQVLQHLHSQRLATSNSYVTMLCFLLEQGQSGSFKQLYSTMQQQGIQPDDHGWEKLLYAAEEFGMQQHVLQLKQQQETQQQRRLSAMRMGPQRFTFQQQQQQQQQWRMA